MELWIFWWWIPMGFMESNCINYLWHCKIKIQSQIFHVFFHNKLSVREICQQSLMGIPMMNPDILFPGESNPEDTRRQLECVHVTRKNKSNRGLTQRTQTTRFWHRAWHAQLLARRLKSDSFWPGGSFVLSRAWIARQRMRDCVMLLHSIAITRRTGYYVFLFLVNMSSFDDLRV